MCKGLNRYLKLKNWLNSLIAALLFYHQQVLISFSLFGLCTISRVLFLDLSTGGRHRHIFFFFFFLGGNTPKKFWRGCAARIFDRIPLAKEILVENIPLAKEHFLVMSPFLQNFREFQPKYSPFKRNFPKIDANLAPKCQFLRVFVKYILG